MAKEYIEQDGDVVRVRTCAWSPPGDHPVGCGMYLTVKDGKVVKVEGDPEHPITNGRLCPRCLAIKEYMYNKDRVLHPLKRDPKDRGKDKWEQITWDEALDIIEERTNYIKETYGPEAIVTFQGTGREACLYAPALTFAVLGTPNTCFPMSGVSCYGPRCAVADFTLGAGYPELDYAAYFPDRYDDPRYEVPKYIVLWGKDPLYSNPDGFFGHALIDLMKRGSKIITVDPRVTWLGVRAAYHLQLRPGTDAAVALGMLNVIIGEDLYNHDFVDNWCYGFDELAERVKEYPPSRVEEISWVPSETLVAAARAFATNSPSSIMWGLAIDENTNGVQAGHALLAIAAITGNLDVPGGLTLSAPSSFMGKWRFDIFQNLSPELQAKRITDPSYAAFNTGTSAHPDIVLETMETGKPYPLKMGWVASTNMLASTTSAQPWRWYNAVKQLEFVVCQDVFLTPTAMAFADVFLPLATFAEHDGIVLPHFGRNTHMLAAMNKAVEVGDCKSDLEIDFVLGKRLNPEAWPWESVADFFTDQIQPMLGITFEDLQNEVVHQQKFEYRKYEKGLLRPDGYPGFNTPTGMVELSATLYPDFGEDALPYFKEPVYSPISCPELAEEYPLVLTTGSREIVSFHSEHRQVPSLRKFVPDPIVEIHPDTAARYGIEDGDWVCIENMLGRAVERARLTPVLSPQVVNARHGWWFPEQDGNEPNLYGVWKSQVNTLIPHKKTSVLGYGAPYKNVICKIYKVDSHDYFSEDDAKKAIINE